MQIKLSNCHLIFFKLCLFHTYLWFQKCPTISFSEDNFWSNVLWGTNHLFVTEFCAVLLQRSLIKIGGHYVKKKIKEMWFNNTPFFIFRHLPLQKLHLNAACTKYLQLMSPIFESPKSVSLMWPVAVMRRLKEKKNVKNNSFTETYAIKFYKSCDLFVTLTYQVWDHGELLHSCVGIPEQAPSQQNTSFE